MDHAIPAAAAALPPLVVPGCDSIAQRERAAASAVTVCRAGRRRPSRFDKLSHPGLRQPATL